MKIKFDWWPLILVIITVLWMLIIMSGCQIIEDETGHHIRLNPFVHKQIGDTAQAGVDILGMLSMFIPALAPVAAAGATGTYVWKRMGKKVTKYQTPLKHLVSTVEVIKRNKPKLWDDIKPLLKGDADVKDWIDKPSAKTEATIRELVDKNNGAV